MWLVAPVELYERVVAVVLKWKAETDIILKFSLPYQPQTIPFVNIPR